MNIKNKYKGQYKIAKSITIENIKQTKHKGNNEKDIKH